MILGIGIFSQRSLLGIRFFVGATLKKTKQIVGKVSCLVIVEPSLYSSTDTK